MLHVLKRVDYVVAVLLGISILFTLASGIMTKSSKPYARVRKGHVTWAKLTAYVFTPVTALFIEFTLFLQGRTYNTFTRVHLWIVAAFLFFLVLALVINGRKFKTKHRPWAYGCVISGLATVITGIWLLATTGPH